MPRRPRKTKDGCYFCGRPATGLEHVPPKAFFPEDKDLPPNHPSVRRNLITVPSCSAHNNSFSNDDEVVAYQILVDFETNALGRHQFTTKALRALKRSGALRRRMIRRAVPIVLPDGSSTEAWFVDPALIDREMEKIARGLHWNDFHARWHKDLFIVNDALRMSTLRRPLWARQVDDLKRAFRLAELTGTSPKKGTNPSVFYYQWLFDTLEPVTVRMCFYEGMNFFATAIPSTAASNPG